MQTLLHGFLDVLCEIVSCKSFLRQEDLFRALSDWSSGRVGGLDLEVERNYTLEGHSSWLAV